MRRTWETLALAAGLLWTLHELRSVSAENLVLRGRVDMLEASHSVLDEKLGEVEGDVGDLETKADDLDSRVGDLEP